MRTATERLFDSIAAHGDRATEVATRALVVAGEAHRGQFRKSREPYVTHPVAVAARLAELRADLDTLVAALLHDVPFDTDYPIDAIRSEFGDPVADLIAGVDRLDGADYPAHVGQTDRRVLLIKIADRLHNMQTIRFLERSSQQRKSDHTLSVVVPLVRDMGLAEVAVELEILATATLHRCASPTDFGTTDRDMREARSGIRTASLLLRVAGSLLPTYCRAAKIAEWEAELYAFPTLREKVVFTRGLLLRGIPEMAVEARLLGRRQ